MSSLETRPSPEAASAVAHDLALEAVAETAGLARSYAASVVEAAWRGDELTVQVHLRQLHDCVVAAIGVFKARNGDGA